MKASIARTLIGHIVVDVNSMEEAADIAEILPNEKFLWDKVEDEISEGDDCQ